jgi:uncharacterized repeat protein (TIGR04042 family)
VPELDFQIEWPTGEKEWCYSPSYVVEDYLAVGHSYALDEFLDRTRQCLRLASERVYARYGMACSSALDQWARIEQKASCLPLAQREGRIKVLAFEKHPPRDARARSDDARDPEDAP